MGVKTTTSVATKNHTHTQHYFHSEEHHHFPSKSILIISITLASLILLLAISLIIFILRRLKSSTNNNPICEHNPSTRFIASTTSTNFNSSPDVKGGCVYGGTGTREKCRGVQVFTYKELEVATEGFSEANVIGNGGLMYKGVLSDGTSAAIKLLGREGKQGERAFRIEVDVLSRLKSAYLVELIGYCADQEHRLLVFEYVGNGTLQRHLQKEGEALDWWKRMRIALDCARALEFLHEHAAAPTPLIHPHFNSSNLLLDQNLRAKLSHFGFGIGFSNNHISTTSPYFAPECESSGKLTTKSNVYSYGVVLLELLTGRVPVDINRPHGQHVLVSWALPRLTNREKVEEMVDPALLGKYSQKDLVQVAAIAAMCIQPEAEYRPLMTDVVQSLIPLVRNPYSITSSNSLRFHKHTSTPSR